MSRRRRRIATTRGPSRQAVILQVAVLILALIILLAYRDRAGQLAGLFFGAVSDDVVVQEREEPQGDGDGLDEAKDEQPPGNSELPGVP